MKNFVVSECSNCHLASVYQVKERKKIFSCSFCSFYGPLSGNIFLDESKALKKKSLVNKRIGLGRVKK